MNQRVLTKSDKKKKDNRLSKEKKILCDYDIRTKVLIYNSKSRLCFKNAT